MDHNKGPRESRKEIMASIGRRTFLVQSSALFGSALFGSAWLSSAICYGHGNTPRFGLSGGDDDPAQTAAEMMTLETRQAVQRGLDYLARRQNDDGSFGDGPYSRNVGVCGLAGLAFLSQGSTPGRGRYGNALTRCVQFVLSCCEDDGFITSAGYQSHGPMYGHGFATLLLAEVYGMAPNLEIRNRLIAAVGIIIDSQNEDGGWRYQPQRNDADLSVTVCQVMALRAARNAGIYVPNETIDRSVDYIKRSQNADGGFAYMLDGGESDFPRSAAGIVALYNAGIYEGDEIERGLTYLEAFRPATNTDMLASHFYYGHYYAVQAMWQAGGARWANWYPSIRDMLIQRQMTGGQWMDPIGPEYGTAMATVVLQMPNNYLPIFQR